MVLASEPVGGRSRVTELPCCDMLYTCIYLVLDVVSVRKIKEHQKRNRSLRMQVILYLRDLLLCELC